MRIISIKNYIVVVSLLSFSSTLFAASRDYISVVGSSTVYPFATVVAERFGKNTGSLTPKIESTGSGGGMKLFCSGIGTKYPDITNSSRQIKESEFKKCQDNGVTEIIEVLIGYDGIVLSNSIQSKKMNLTRKDIYLALADKIPDLNGKLVKNPNKTWQDINPSLPNKAIVVIGPPPTSGTRDAFVELAMEGGAKSFKALKALRESKDSNKIIEMMRDLDIPASAFNEKGKKVFKAITHAIREDGAYIEAGENDNLIIQKLESNPDALGIFGYSFLDQNSDKVQGSTVELIEPTFESIADKSYSIARPLYFYIKKAHINVVPRIADYAAEFSSEKAWGSEGYLADKGMIPLSKDLRSKFSDDIKNMTTMKGVE